MRPSNQPSPHLRNTKLPSSKEDADAIVQAIIEGRDGEGREK
jgi:hypothetical protein